MLMLFILTIYDIIKEKIGNINQAIVNFYDSDALYLMHGIDVPNTVEDNILHVNETDDMNHVNRDSILNEDFVWEGSTQTNSSPEEITEPIQKIVDHVKEITQDHISDKYISNENIISNEINDTLLYKTVYNYIHFNNITTDMKILIECNGDKKSMALLAVLSNIYSIENIHLVVIQDDLIISHFFESLNDFSEFTCHIHGKNENKLNIYKNICEENNIKQIFNASTMENMMLYKIDCIMKGVQYDNMIYTPFENILNKNVEEFVDDYNIVYIEHVENKKITNEYSELNSMMNVLCNKYPCYNNWKYNIINYNKKNN
jgi:hypothetical protein